MRRPVVKQPEFTAETIDARQWARAFVKKYDRKHRDQIDQDVMFAWFTNAIHAGLRQAPDWMRQEMRILDGQVAELNLRRDDEIRELRESLRELELEVNRLGKSLRRSTATVRQALLGKKKASRRKAGRAK